jgi:hypothetical protein
VNDDKRSAHNDVYADGVMRFAYADPPYVGCSSRYDHPDAARWDDPTEHVALMHQLELEYHGWALSCSSPSLRELLPGAPPRARVRGAMILAALLLICFAGFLVYLAGTR